MIAKNTKLKNENIDKTVQGIYNTFLKKIVKFCINMFIKIYNLENKIYNKQQH